MDGEDRRKGEDLELAFLVFWPLAFDHLGCSIPRESLLNFETLILERVKVRKRRS